MKKVVILFMLVFVGKSLLADNEIYLKTIDVTKHGVLPDDNHDDSNALQELLKALEKKPGNYTLLFPEGTYNINRRVTATNLCGVLSLKGDRGSRIVFENNGFLHLQAKSFKFDLAAPLQRNDTIIYIEKKEGFRMAPGDIMHIGSSSRFDIAWNYKENDTHRIVKVENNQVSVNSPVLFNYTPQTEEVTATIYKYLRIDIEDIDFVLGAEKDIAVSSSIRTMVNLTGASVKMKNAEVRYEGPQRYKHIGFSIVASESVYFDGMILDNFMYPILLNYCRNVKALNTIAYYCRHAYTLAQACYDVYIENLKGVNCHSAMDAHLSFYVHYKNVLDTLATQFPNCRSLGTTIENAKIYVDADAYQDYAYWSVQTLAPEYEFLSGEFDTRFSNVHWVPKRRSSFNGLTSFTCRKFVVDNCTTSVISYYGDQTVLQEVKVTNSRVGMLRIDGYKTEVDSTVFDGSLFPEAPFVLRFTGRGESRLNNIRIRNYDPDITYLFGYLYNLPTGNSILINSSEICLLKGVCKQFGYPGRTNDGVSLNAAKLEGFVEPYPGELPRFKKEMEKSGREWIMLNMDDKR